jgi:hypothetical protein
MGAHVNFLTATGFVMSCISDIKRRSWQLKYDNTTSFTDTANDLFARLEKCRNLTLQQVNVEDLYCFSKHKLMAFYHLNAFIAATYIYLYQTLFDLPPKKLSSYVSEVFYNVQSFNALDNGNCCLWPAFIAALASFEEEDVALARSWLDRVSNSEMGQRMNVRCLVEEVWRVRATTAAETGRELGSTNVDIGEVMEVLAMVIGPVPPGPRYLSLDKFDERCLDEQSIQSFYCR